MRAFFIDHLLPWQTIPLVFSPHSPVKSNFPANPLCEMKHSIEKRFK